MDNKAPRANIDTITAMGSRPLSSRPRFKMAMAGLALAAAIGAVAMQGNDAPAPETFSGQANVVAKIMVDSAPAIQEGQERIADQDAPARHNLLLEHDGGNYVVSVSPEVFAGVCQHVDEAQLAQWRTADGHSFVACGTQYNIDGEPPEIVIDKLDTLDASFNSRDGLSLKVSEQSDPDKSTFRSRLENRRPSAPADKGFSI